MTMTKRITRFLLPLLFWLLVWTLASFAIDQQLLLPSPFAVARRFFALSATKEFWLSAVGSLGRIGLGYLLALLTGVVFAILTSFSKGADLLFSPLLRVIKTVPVASFIVLALLWLNKGIIPAFIAFLMVLPLVWANVSEGIAQTDKILLEMGHCFGLSPWGTLKKISLPAARPYFFSAAQTGLGFAWKSGVAAEVLSMPNHAIGTNLYQAKIYLETPDLFAWTVLLVLLSLGLEKIFGRLAHFATNARGVRP